MLAVSHADTANQLKEQNSSNNSGSWKGDSGKNGWKEQGGSSNWKGSNTNSWKEQGSSNSTGPYGGSPGTFKKSQFKCLKYQSDRCTNGSGCRWVHQPMTWQEWTGHLTFMGKEFDPSWSRIPPRIEDIPEEHKGLINSWPSGPITNNGAPKGKGKGGKTGTTDATKGANNEN